MKRARWYSSSSLPLMLSIVVGCIALRSIAYTGTPRKTEALPQSTLVDSSYVPFLINDIFAYFGNNGDGSYNPFATGKEGFEFRRGQDKHLVYEDGIVWGGFCGVNKELKVGGSMYRHAMQPGRIIITGTATTAPVADSSGSKHNRVYRVRPDVRPSTDTTAALALIAQDEVPFIGRYQTTTASAIMHQYMTDWIEWPASEGAPFTDVDGDGRYDPTVDIPGEPGADQTLWYVANDLDSSRTILFSNSSPIGLEMQKTIWGYRRNMGALTTSIFARTVLVNKSGGRIDSMFIMQFSDPDIGDGGDDFVGCDTTLNLSFGYNGNAVDAEYGTESPAVGYVLLEGPLVASPGNAGLFDRRRVDGKRNLGRTSFSFWQPPSWGEVVEEPIGWYNTMNGLLTEGVPYIDPITSKPTKFPMSGNPVADPDSATTWVDGKYGLLPIDQRLYMSTGPFTMANGDTQEVVIATVGAQGSDRLASVGLLKTAVASLIQGIPDLLVSAPQHTGTSVPTGFVLYQNYPNPFNPKTVVSGQWSVPSVVRIVVYDILGREVAVLADGRYPAGKHTFSFDGTHFSSGVYFYRLTAGNFWATKAMILLK